MAIDRKLFKATSTEVLKEQKDRVESQVHGSNRAKFHKIEKGANKFRFYPAHPGTSNFIYEKVIAWLPQEIPAKDGAEAKIERRPIFNSRTHGGTKKDIVEEYIKFVVRQLTEEIQDEKELSKRLDPILNWKTGIKAGVSWVAYADKINSLGEAFFGMVNVTDGTKNKLNELAIVEDPNEPISVDPFTNPDTGKAVVITYTPDAKAKGDVYKVTLLWQKNSPLSESQLEAFSEVETLQSMFRNSYTRKDFERALDGLQIIDAEHGYDAFQNDNWLEIVEEIDRYYPEEGETAAEEVAEEIAEEATESIEEVEAEEVEEVKEEKPVFKTPAATAAKETAPPTSTSARATGTSSLRDKYKKK